MLSRRSQQIIAIASILSLILLTLTLASMFNPKLAAFKRFLDLSGSEANSSINSINRVYRSPDFHVHNKFLELRPSSTIDVRSNSSLQLNEFTVAAWFKTSHFYFDAQEPTPYHFIVNKGGIGSENASKNMNYGIWMNDLHNIQGGFETKTGIDYFVKAGDTKYNDGKWHYVAVEWVSGTLKLYIDGLTVATANSVAAPTTPAGLVAIGAHGGGSWFNGDIDNPFVAAQ